MMMAQNNLRPSQEMRVGSTIAVGERAGCATTAEVVASAGCLGPAPRFAGAAVMYDQSLDFGSVFAAFDQLLLVAGLTLQLKRWRGKLDLPRIPGARFGAGRVA